MSLSVGDKVPNFSSINDTGETFDSSLIIGKKPTVLYFYPKNFTPGCTKEACSFRDLYQDFKEMGCEVVAVSSDSINSHQKFKTKYQLPFTFLSDKKGKLKKLFGVKPELFGLLPGRETYVIDHDGVIQLKFNSMQASKHVPIAMETMKKIMSER